MLKSMQLFRYPSTSPSLELLGVWAKLRILESFEIIFTVLSTSLSLELILSAVSCSTRRLEFVRLLFI